MPVIQYLTASEILDSRGRPTLRATCRLEGGASASASVPSGASTGSAEALELRDGDPQRYRGLGCRRAAANVSGPIADDLRGRDIAAQHDLDRLLIELDGTPNKSRLGANALLAVSLAFARAHAADAGVPFYQHLSGLIAPPCPARRTLPRMTINLFSGGKHAGAQLAVQDILVVPIAARTIDEGLAATFAVYQAAAELILRKYNMRVLRADEGGLAPAFPSTETALSDAVEAIEAAGFQPGRDVALAVDVASTHFYREGHYHLDGQALAAAAMIERIAAWTRDYPIISVEDGLAEEDWAHWPALRAAIGGRGGGGLGGALVLGDDLLCTNPARIRRAIESNAANALLLKVNQVGTLTEAADACRLARSAGWAVTVSARSGETEDDWLADLAVGWGGDQIKVGSITQSERLAKYNRLLAIEAETHWPVADWPTPSD